MKELPTIDQGTKFHQGRPRTKNSLYGDDGSAILKEQDPI